MNILFINSAISWGGGERWLYDISEGLSNKGHKITIACRHGSAIQDMIPRSIAETIPIHITGDYNLITIGKLYRIIKQEDIQLVCTNFEKDFRLGALAGTLANVPVVASREVDFPIKNKWVNKFFYTKLASGVLINSYATLNTILVNAPWLKKQRMSVVWKGISPSFQSTREQPRALRSEVTQIGFVGRLDEQKGIPTLLDAIDIAVRRYSSLRLIMAGEGNMIQTIQNYIHDKHLESHIVVAGFQTDIAAFLREVDFVVMPSYWEGFGYAALEAMLLGKAIVATHTSSLPEIILDGKTGILVPPRSAEKLAEAIITLSKNADMRISMGEAGSVRVKEVFLSTTMVNKTESFFFTIMNQHRIHSLERKGETESPQQHHIMLTRHT